MKRISSSVSPTKQQIMKGSYEPARHIVQSSRPSNLLRLTSVAAISSFVLESLPNVLSLNTPSSLKHTANLVAVSF